MSKLVDYCIGVFLVIAIIVVSMLLYNSVARAQEQNTIHVLFVVPSGESITEQEKERARLALAQGIAFWQPYLDETVIIGSETIISVDNPYTGIEWLTPYLNSNNEYTYFFIDNSNYGFLISGYTGVAFFNMAVAGNVLSAPNITNTVTHELGHMLLDLPDYGNCNDDIMCNYGYIGAFPGCRSLIYLEYPCYQQYLPMLKIGT